MEQQAFRQKVKGDQLPDFFRYISDQGIGLDDLVFVCIGTDRSAGDALGPLVGTLLREAGYSDGQVVGSLDKPCDASNLQQRLDEIPREKITIAIDACLGLPTSVGLFQVANHALEPGKSVGKKLPPAGRFSIAAIVNVDRPRQYSVLQSTSLYRIWTMARDITSAVQEVFPLDKTGGQDH